MAEKGHYEFILKAGEKLKALHIGDNEGFSDQHLMPFTRGNVDFGEVVNGLALLDIKAFSILKYWVRI